MRMRRLVLGASALILVGAISAWIRLPGDVTTQAQGHGHGDGHPLVTQAQMDRWYVELSNWGRWGKDDVMGSLNLITPAKIKQAVALVKDGVTVSLAQDELTKKEIDAPCPVVWEMINVSGSGSSDRIAFPCMHGAGHTHIDGFGHHGTHDGKLYNGYSFKEFVTKEGGAKKGNVLAWKNGIVTRAILYDIPRLKGVPYLEPGTRVFREDLEAWEKKIGVKLTPGDALLFRWGYWARRAKVGPWGNGSSDFAGLDESVLPWLKERGVSVLGWETFKWDPKPKDAIREDVHGFVIAYLGVVVLDRADFEALSQMAVKQNRWEFMMSIAPLAIPNGTASPVNPIAVF